MRFKDFTLIPSEERRALGHIPREELQAVGDALEKFGLTRRLPEYTDVDVSLELPVAPGASLFEAYWSGKGKLEDFENLGTPAEFPRQSPFAVCPAGIVRVHVIARLLTHAADWYGYGGGWVSLLVSVPERKVWDARGKFDPTPPSGP